MAKTCRTHGAADVEVYPTDLTDHAAVDSLSKQLLDKHKVCARHQPAASSWPPRRYIHMSLSTSFEVLTVGLAGR